MVQKFDFFKFGYPLALLAKLVNGRKPERFCEQNLQSVYTLALLAKNEQAVKLAKSVKAFLQ